MILREIKEIVRAIIDNIIVRKKVRKEEKNLANIDNKSFLIFLKDDNF